MIEKLYQNPPKNLLDLDLQIIKYLAGKNLLLILRDEATGGHLITVVLGTDDNFADTAALVDWVYQSFRFVRT